MYLAALFALTALLTVALGGMQLAVSLAAAEERHAALAYADIALEQARRALVEQIAAQVRSGSPDGPFVEPPRGELEPVCTTPPGATPPPCPFSARVAVTLLGQTGTRAPGDEVARSVQRAPGASENRLAATLTASIVSAAGTVSESRSLIVRTYAAPPYASDDGGDAPAIGDLRGGDSGGTCDGSPACGGADTRVHAKLVCSDPVLPARCAGVPDRYVDRFEDETWYDAHVWSAP